MTAAPVAVPLVLAWGTVVGLDLASGPQVLVSRPLVAGVITGALLGDVGAGLRVGAALELYALAVLPVGAARYPDYGTATTAGVAALAGRDWTTGLGVALLLALGLARLSVWTLDWLRHANARALAPLDPALAGGDAGGLVRLHYGSLWRDGLRSAGLTALGLAAALGLVPHLALPARLGTLLTLGLVGAGLAVALAGTLRLAGDPRRLRLAALGVVLGLLGWLA